MKPNWEPLLNAEQTQGAEQLRVPTECQAGALQTLAADGQFNWKSVQLLSPACTVQWGRVQWDPVQWGPVQWDPVQ